MIDALLSFGDSRSSRGAPPNRGRGLLAGPARQTQPTGTRGVTAGQQLGANAVSLVRGSFLRNLDLVVAHVGRITNRRTGQLAADSSGNPEAPHVTGWDGVPLDRAGL